jgi:hypothetical protein
LNASTKAGQPPIHAAQRSKKPTTKSIQNSAISAVPASTKNKLALNDPETPNNNSDVVHGGLMSGDSRGGAGDGGLLDEIAGVLAPATPLVNEGRQPDQLDGQDNNLNDLVSVASSLTFENP